MISVRNLLLGIVLGAIVALVVRQIGAHGFAIGQWNWRGPDAGQSLVTGALIGAICQLFGASKGRR